MTRPLVVAHRAGAWADLPGEQTVAHVERAIGVGADFVEVDIRRTGDGHLVCHHDADTAGLAVADHPLSALRAAAPGPISTLAEVLEVARGRVGLDIELKLGGFEAELLTEVHAGFGDERVVFKSFDDDVVRRLRTLAPGCTAGLLLGVERPRFGPLTRAGEVFPAARLLLCGARFVSPHHRLLRAGFVRRMRAGGWPVWVWTVNEPELMERLVGQVDAVVTDDPARALEMRRAGRG